MSEITAGHGTNHRRVRHGSQTTTKAQSTKCRCSAISRTVAHSHTRRPPSKSNRRCYQGPAGSWTPLGSFGPLPRAIQAYPWD